MILSNFKLGLRDFAETIIGMGGKWATDDVHFSEDGEHYIARYIPLYPNISLDDDEITLSKKDCTWQFAGKCTI